MYLRIKTEGYLFAPQVLIKFFGEHYEVFDILVMNINDSIMMVEIKNIVQSISLFILFYHYKNYKLYEKSPCLTSKIYSIGTKCF